MTPKQLGAELLVKAAALNLGHSIHDVTEDIAKKYFENHNSAEIADDVLEVIRTEYPQFAEKNFVVVNLDTLDELAMHAIKDFIRDNLRDNPLRNFINEAVLAEKIFYSPACDKLFIPKIVANIRGRVFVLDI